MKVLSPKPIRWLGYDTTSFRLRLARLHIQNFASRFKIHQFVYLHSIMTFKIYAGKEKK